jgi:hypothetical protein
MEHDLTIQCSGGWSPDRPDIAPNQWTAIAATPREVARSAESPI